MSQSPALHPLLARDVIVVNQKAKLFELNNEFGLFDEQQLRVGSVVQVGQSSLTLLARIFSDLDVALPVTLEIREQSGQPVLRIHKPWFRRSCTVQRADGAPLGSVSKEIRFGKARFMLADATGRRLGVLLARNWRARDFSVRNEADVEVGRVTKKWAGLAKEFFTDADNYVITLSPDLADPLRSLAIASCLAVDTVMKQKDAG